MLSSATELDSSDCLSPSTTDPLAPAASLRLTPALFPCPSQPCLPRRTWTPSAPSPPTVPRSAKEKTGILGREGPLSWQQVFRSPWSISDPANSLQQEQRGEPPASLSASPLEDWMSNHSWGRGSTPPCWEVQETLKLRACWVDYILSNQVLQRLLRQTGLQIELFFGKTKSVQLTTRKSKDAHHVYTLHSLGRDLWYQTPQREKLGDKAVSASASASPLKWKGVTLPWRALLHPRVQNFVPKGGHPSLLMRRLFLLGLVALHHCGSFCCAAKCLSHVYIYIPSSFSFLPIQVTAEH